MNRYDKECVESLQKLISIKSVKYDGADEYVPVAGKPFGNGISDALNYVLELCVSMGMRTKNCGGYAGYAEVGEGEELIGILCHLDVVPEGNGWSFPPYEGVVKDGKLYGRGAIDDKGPAVASIYALKSLMDEGVSFNKRVRLIFGTDEENNWEDMDYYLANEECPSMGFTPDADFPLIYGEMGILQFEYVLYFKEENNIDIEGGVATNSVADFCNVRLKKSDKTVIEEIGVAAHASTPWEGENAIEKAMQKLNGANTDLDISDELRRFAEFYCNRLANDIHGEKLNCNLEDEESGKLTVSVGKIRTDDDCLRLSVDMRIPVTYSDKDVISIIEKAGNEAGLEVENIDYLKPVFSPCDSPLIKILLDVYQEKTGDMTRPLTMGGGTYARAMDNIVAFGPLFPGREATEHMGDEYIILEDLYKIYSIYKMAIKRLLEC